MAWRLVKKEEGVYNIFSTVVDDFVYEDCSKDDIIELFQERAKETVKEEALRALEMCEAGIRTMSYEEALETISWRNTVHEDE